MDVGRLPQEVIFEVQVVHSRAPHHTMLGPRERALDEGIRMLTDSDLLAIVLGTGLSGCPVTQLSLALIERFGGIDGLARLAPTAIAEHPGLGLVKALRVAASLEMGRRALIRSVRPRPEMWSSASVAGWFTGRLGWKDQEEMWVLSLDARNGLRSARRVGQGGTNGVIVSPRDVLRVALQDAASAVILVHNHPSGDPTPSEGDVEMTKAVAAGAGAIGLPLLDHVIVSSTGKYTSMLDLGILPPT